MTLSFKAKRGFLGVSVNGEIEVFDDYVTIDVNLSSLITSFISEEAIRKTIIEHAESLLTEHVDISVKAKKQGSKNGNSG